MPRALPKLQRVAAYALILRDDQILLTRLARKVSADEKWHLPGGGLDHGEDPRDALVREVREETGLDAEVGETAHVYSAHLPSMWRQGRRWDYQALRIVYDAWVPADAPEPRVRGGRRLHDGRRLAPGRRRPCRAAVRHRCGHRGTGRPQRRSGCSGSGSTR